MSLEKFKVVQHWMDKGWTASELVLSFDTGCDAEFSSAVSLGSLVRQIWWIKNSHKEGPKAIITGPKAK